MKESISNAFLFNFMIFFITTFIIIFVGSISYSKAFKVKSKIVDIIELHRGYNGAARGEIERYLRDVGYKTNARQMRGCPSREGSTISSGLTDFRYCVYENETVNGIYYTVASFIYFDFPVINNLLEFPVFGETKIIYDLD